MYKRIKLISALLLVSLCVFSQAGDTIRNYQYAIDLYKINNAFDKLSNTAVTFQFLYSLSDNPGHIVDSMQADYHLEKGMMRGHLGDVELLRNTKYSLSVSPEDSFIAISNLGSGSGTFQINVFDSLFRKVNIEGLDRSMNGGLTTTAIIFKPDSYYKNYSISYNSNYLITKIHVEYMDTDYDDSGNPPPAGRRKIMEVLFNNYHTEDYDISNFDEGLFVKKDEYGKWIGIGAYEGFQVMPSSPDL